MPMTHTTLYHYYMLLHTFLGLPVVMPMGGRHLRGYVAEYRSSAPASAGVSDSRKTTESTLPPRRSHRRQAGAYARRHGLVLAALLDAWLPRSRMVSRRPRATPASRGGGGGANVSRGASVATRPATSAGLGAHGPEQPRTPSVTEGQVTSRQIRHTPPPLARMASSRILLALPWAEGLEVAPDGSVL